MKELASDVKPQPLVKWVGRPSQETNEGTKNPVKVGQQEMTFRLKYPLNFPEALFFQLNGEMMKHKG